MTIKESSFKSTVVCPGSPEEIHMKECTGLTCEDWHNVTEANILSKWDFHHMAMAKFFGLFSKCMSRQIGAIIVSDKRIISTGYNGPPEGAHHCDSKERLDEIIVTYYNAPCDRELAFKLSDEWGTACPRKVLGFKSGEGLHLCPAAHAETNAIVNAARDGSKVKGATMYCYCPMPCFECTKLIINAGIRKVFYTSGSSYDKMSPLLFKGSNAHLIPVSKETVDQHYLSLMPNLVEAVDNAIYSP